MFSQLFVLSPRGDILVYRDCTRTLQPASPAAAVA